MLRNISILIVEDEPFIALDIAMEVESAGGVVVGPANSASDAIYLLGINAVQGAVLDVHLLDGDVAPVARHLSILGVPFLFHCGAGLTPALKAAYPNVEVYSKPTTSPSLVKALASLVRSNGAIEI